MLNSRHYFIICKIIDISVEHKFFGALHDIDSEPLELINLKLYAIKSGLSANTIFKFLSATINMEDELIICGIPAKLEYQAPDFAHWLRT